MATGVCYTQSGGVKKYDGIVVPGVAKGDKSYNPGYENIKHDTSSVPGEDHYSFDDPSSYTLIEKGSSARDDCPLIIVTYYPVAPANPCYFNYKKKEGTGGIGYDLYCRVLYINDNEIDNSYNPNYSKFSNKFGINIDTYAREITYGEIYKDYKDGYFCGTFYSYKEDIGSDTTGSDTIEATIKLESIIPGGQVNNGEVQFEFFLIPKDSNPDNYKNQPSIDGEISPTSEIIDNRIYNKGNQWGISKGNYAMDHPISDLDQNNYEQCNLTIGVRCNFNFNCKNLNKDDLNNWSLGDLSGIYTKVKNRYSTTIPYLKLNIIWDMNN